MNNLKKIKVLHVYRSMNLGGAETFIMNVFKKIDRSMVQFDFLCTTNELGVYDDEIIKMGGNILHYNTFYKNNPYKMIRDTIGIINENGPYDIIHIPLQFYSAFYCIAAKKSGINKIIVHSHSAGDKRSKHIFRKIYMKIMRLIINRFSDVRIACGEKASKYLFGTTKDVIIIYNGIDIDKFKNVCKNDITKIKCKYKIKNELIIGHVGRFADEKNHVFFIDIAKTLRKRGINFKILFVGDGPNYNNIRELVSENKLEDFFVFVGLQKKTELFYSLFNVYVLPSLYEGFPVSVIEALASGVPCILSDTITKEVDIIKGTCSFIDIHRDVDYWCDEILRISRIKFDKNINYEVLNNSGFSVESTSKQILDIYKEGLDKNEKM